MSHLVATKIENMADHIFIQVGTALRKNPSVILEKLSFTLNNVNYRVRAIIYYRISIKHYFLKGVGKDDKVYIIDGQIIVPKPFELTEHEVYGIVGERES